jgi:aldehyde dehydrogenase (NAD+)
MTVEMGKPIREARVEVARGAAILRFYAGEALRPIGEVHHQLASTESLVYTLRRPLGVVALITPWNFPCAIPAWKTAPALVYGNAVVLKVAQAAPAGALHLTECLTEAGLPDGVLNVLVGAGSEVGAPLIADPRTRGISFTGSVPVGRSIGIDALRTGKRVQLELGGHNPLIVLADADLDAAVEAAYAGAFWSAGQKCTATRRILVHDRVYEQFRDLLLARIDRGIVGDPLDPEVEVGPVVHETALREIVATIEQALREGGTLLSGGIRLDDSAYLLAPTLFEDVADDAFLSCEEVFGPVAALYRVSSLDEAIRRANAVEFGLAASLFTRDLGAAARFRNTIEAGVARINGTTTGADPHVPFGGLKASGFGPHEQGRSAIEFYTDVVTVYEGPVG